MTDKELNTVRMPVEGRDFTIEPKLREKNG